MATVHYAPAPGMRTLCAAPLHITVARTGTYQHATCEDCQTIAREVTEQVQVCETLAHCPQPHLTPEHVAIVQGLTAALEVVTEALRATAGLTQGDFTLAPPGIIVCEHDDVEQGSTGWHCRDCGMKMPVRPPGPTGRPQRPTGAPETPTTPR